MIEPVKSTLVTPPMAQVVTGRRGRPLRRADAQRQRLTSIPKHYSYLYVFGLLALILYFDISDPNNGNSTTLFLASSVMVITCLPMAVFLFRGKIYQVPALESHCLFYAMSFGFAGFLPVPAMGGAGTITEAMMDVALINTFIGLVALLVGYYFAGPKLLKKVQPMNIDLGFSLATLEKLAWLASVSCAILAVLAGHFKSLELVGQIALFTYALSFYLLLVLALDKKISPTSRLGVFGLLLPYQILFNSGLGGGQLAGLVILLCWLSLVILRCWRHIPVYLLAGAFLFFIIFQPVKMHVRNMVSETGANLGPAAMIKAYTEGFFETYGSSRDMIANGKDNFDDSFERVNHLALFSAIIRDTPSSQPYLYGQTYIPLLTKPIPRLIWPGKPKEILGNTWAVKYGFLSDLDSGTSFNLPWLPEMYMNGGVVGVVVVMFLLGILFRYLWIHLMNASIGVATYAVALVFAQSLVFVESNLSMMLGGVIMFAMFLWVLFKILAYFKLYSPPPLLRRPVRAFAGPARI